MLLHLGWGKTERGGVDALINVQTSVSGMLQQAEEHLSNSHADQLLCFDGGTVAWWYFLTCRIA